MKLTKTQLEEMKKNGIITEETDLTSFEIVEDDAFITDAQQEKVNSLIVGAKNKTKEQLQKELEQQRADEEEKQRLANLSAEEKWQEELQKTQQELNEFKNATQKEKQEMLEASKRLEFKNRMLTAGVDEQLAENISKTTNIEAIDEYDISILPAKAQKNPGANIEDKNTGKGSNSIMELAKKYI